MQIDEKHVRPSPSSTLTSSTFVWCRFSLRSKFKSASFILFFSLSLDSRHYRGQEREREREKCCLSPRKLFEPSKVNQSAELAAGDNSPLERKTERTGPFISGLPLSLTLKLDIFALMPARVRTRDFSQKLSHKSYVLGYLLVHPSETARK